MDLVRPLRCWSTRSFVAGIRRSVQHGSHLVGGRFTVTDLNVAEIIRYATVVNRIAAPDAQPAEIYDSEFRTAPLAQARDTPQGLDVVVERRSAKDPAARHASNHGTGAPVVRTVQTAVWLSSISAKIALRDRQAPFGPGRIRPQTLRTADLEDRRP
jgi:hypothetical protein